MFSRTFRKNFQKIAKFPIKFSKYSKTSLSCTLTVPCKIVQGEEVYIVQDIEVGEKM